MNLELVDAFNPRRVSDRTGVTPVRVPSRPERIASAGHTLRAPAAQEKNVRLHYAVSYMCRNSDRGSVTPNDDGLGPKYMSPVDKARSLPGRTKSSSCARVESSTGVLVCCLGECLKSWLRLQQLGYPCIIVAAIRLGQSNHCQAQGFIIMLNRHVVHC